MAYRAQYGFVCLVHHQSWDGQGGGDDSKGWQDFKPHLFREILLKFLFDLIFFFEK
jgi:hypothetical protein